MTQPFLSITAIDAQALISQGLAHLVDVREWPDYLQGHISGSVNLPYSTFNPKVLLPHHEDRQTVIIHCYHGIRSQGACLALRTLQPDWTIYNLTGGFAAWKEAGLPTVL